MTTKKSDKKSESNTPAKKTAEKSLFRSLKSHKTYLQGVFLCYNTLEAQFMRYN